MSAGARGNQFSLAVDPFDHDTGAPLPFTTLPPQGRAIGSGDAYVNSRETERERERETERQRERARDRDRERERETETETEKDRGNEEWEGMRVEGVMGVEERKRDR